MLSTESVEVQNAFLYYNTEVEVSPCLERRESGLFYFKNPLRGERYNN